MKNIRFSVSPSTFDAIQKGIQTALVVPDEGVAHGDEYILTRALRGEYMGPGGVYPVRVTHVNRENALLSQAGECIVCVKGPGERVRLCEVGR